MIYYKMIKIEVNFTKLLPDENLHGGTVFNGHIRISWSRWGILKS